MTDADLRAFGTKHNDHLWNGDVFELFFKPRLERPEYFEFQVNPKSVLFEAAFLGPDKPIASFDKIAPMGMSAVARTDGTLDRPGDSDKGWTVEGRIPWTAFAPFDRPEPGAVWSFALCRYDSYGPQGTRPLTISSAPLPRRDFHR